jgi:hypothetical protein
MNTSGEGRNNIKTDAESAAQAELKHGENLIYSEMNAGVTGCVTLLLLGVFIILGILMLISQIRSDIVQMQAIIMAAVFIAVGVAVFCLFVRANSIAKGNYIFVSDQRLCIRGKTFLGKLADRDIPIRSIKDVSLDADTVNLTANPRTMRTPRYSIHYVKVVLEDKKRVAIRTRNLSGLVSALQSVIKK